MLYMYSLVEELGGGGGDFDIFKDGVMCDIILLKHRNNRDNPLSVYLILILPFFYCTRIK